MKEVKVRIANKTYTVKLAITEEQQIEGLQGVTNLPENEGMLFIFKDPEEIGF